MGFSSIYKSLIEVFPQVDSRILKAVAIEHSEDADAAVETVLSEIIPFILRHSMVSNPPCKDHPPIGILNEGTQEEQCSMLHQPVIADPRESVDPRAPIDDVTEQMASLHECKDGNFVVEVEHAEPLENSTVQTLGDEVSDLCLECSSSPSANLENLKSMGEVSKMDHLDDVIKGAKTNKQVLFSSMELVIKLMRQVELEERAAEQAEEEATQGGADLLVKVEELKEMLVHAKNANEMRAGEVDGEKAILATEVKELQARLLNVSDEKDRSLAVLYEMRQSLEGRLAAAEEVKKAAEHEKIGREISAQNALAEQEAIMEKVVQHSKILQQLAEENSKLQEFLMDRGRIVDALQGEMAVICQDVKLLKEKYDEHIPLCKSISSSQTSCVLASWSSSLKSLPVHTAPASDGQQKKSIAGMDCRSEKHMLDHDELSDAGWDFFDV